MKLLKVAQATAKQKGLFLQDFLVPSSAAAGTKTRSGCTPEKQNYVHTQDQGFCDISNCPSPKPQLKAFKKHEAPTCARTQIKNTMRNATLRLLPADAEMNLFRDKRSKLRRYFRSLTAVRGWMIVIACFVAQSSLAQDDSPLYDARDFLSEHPEIRIVLDGFGGSISNPEFSLDPITFSRGRKGKTVVLLNDHTRVRMWGLKFTDLERASLFLIGLSSPI